MPTLEAACKPALHRCRHRPRVFLFYHKVQHNQSLALVARAPCNPHCHLTLRLIAAVFCCDMGLLCFTFTAARSGAICFAPQKPLLQGHPHVWKFGERLYFLVHTHITQAWLRYSSSLVVSLYLHEEWAGTLESNCSPKVSKFSL